MKCKILKIQHIWCVKLNLILRIIKWEMPEIKKNVNMKPKYCKYETRIPVVSFVTV